MKNKRSMIIKIMGFLIGAFIMVLGKKLGLTVIARNSIGLIAIFAIWIYSDKRNNGQKLN